MTKGMTMGHSILKKIIKQNNNIDYLVTKIQSKGNLVARSIEL